MKKLIMVLAVFAVVGQLPAQSLEKGERKAKMEMRKEKVELSDSQKEEMEIRKTAYEKVLSNESMTREEKKSKIIEMKKSQGDILTEDQKMRSKEMKLERSADRMIQKHERKQKRNELKSYRSEFDTQISDDDRQALAKIRKTMKQKRESKGEEKRVNKEEMKMLRSLSLKYEDKVESFLKEKGVERSEFRKGKRKGRGNRGNTGVNDGEEGSGEKMKKKKKDGRLKTVKNRKAKGVSKFLLMEF